MLWLQIIGVRPGVIESPHDALEMEIAVVSINEVRSIAQAMHILCTTTLPIDQVHIDIVTPNKDVRLRDPGLILYKEVVVVR